MFVIGIVAGQLERNADVIYAQKNEVLVFCKSYDYREITRLTFHPAHLGAKK